MYLARFCYDVLPVNRQRAIDFIHREVENRQCLNPKIGGDASAWVRIQRKPLEFFWEFEQ